MDIPLDYKPIIELLSCLLLALIIIVIWLYKNIKRDNKPENKPFQDGKMTDKFTVICNNIEYPYIMDKAILRVEGNIIFIKYFNSLKHFRSVCASETRGVALIEEYDNPLKFKIILEDEVFPCEPGDPVLGHIEGDVFVIVKTFRT